MKTSPWPLTRKEVVAWNNLMEFNLNGGKFRRLLSLLSVVTGEGFSLHRMCQPFLKSLKDACLLTS